MWARQSWQSYLLDPFDRTVSFEHQAWHMDCFILGDIQWFERIRSLLSYCTKMDAHDFPHSEAAVSSVVFQPNSVTDVELYFRFHKGLTSHFSEPGFRVSVASDPSGEPGR